ncbi:MAG: nuclear transport factor 2 family protein [Verrucomicrobia bacterium]|nr:nuclear transport factor 2 family protein [Verrucomicrobiota bacterium]
MNAPPAVVLCCRLETIYSPPMRLLPLLIFSLALAACRTAPVVLDTARPYHEALAAISSKPTVAKGSEAERAAIARVKDFFAVMNEETVRAKTKQVYAADAYLNDTLKTLHGNAAIEDYFLATARESESITVQFDDVAESGGNYYFRWVMDTRLKKLRKGETIRTIGITHIRFDADGRVALHQDFWDTAAGLYEHVPVVGTMIRSIKAKF